MVLKHFSIVNEMRGTTIIIDGECREENGSTIQPAGLLQSAYQDLPFVREFEVLSLARRLDDRGAFFHFSATFTTHLFSRMGGP